VALFAFTFSYWCFWGLLTGVSWAFYLWWAANSIAYIVWQVMRNFCNAWGWNIAFYFNLLQFSDVVLFQSSELPYTFFDSGVMPMLSWHNCLHCLINIVWYICNIWGLGSILDHLFLVSCFLFLVCIYEWYLLLQIVLVRTFSTYDELQTLLPTLFDHWYEKLLQLLRMKHWYLL
jgi:hypothetical protein